MTAITNAQYDNSGGKRMLLTARPGPISIDIARTAVIVVDMQNDFGSDGGMFDRAGISISGIKSIIGPTANVLAAARNAGIRIVYLKMGFSSDLSDMGREGSPNRLQHQKVHVGDTIDGPNGKTRILIRDSWGTDIVPALKPVPEDLIVCKTRFSGFFNTNLDSLLKQLNIDYLIFTGCTTSICVESTFRDAVFRDYSPVVLRDCTAEPIGLDLVRSNYDASLFIFEKMGWVSTSEEFIKVIAH